DGRLAGWLGRGEEQLLTFIADEADGEATRAEIARALADEVNPDGRRTLFIETVDGAPVDETLLAGPLREAGFARTPRGYLKRVTARELALNPGGPQLGPDVIADGCGVVEALRRLQAAPERDIATALLDQRTVSGIGNEIKNETLFLSHVWPWTRVADLDDDSLRHVLDVARDLLRRNREGGPRRTRFALDRRQLVWVQERTGKPCYECGAPIAWGNHPGEFRRSYYCPGCQRQVERSVLSPLG